MVRRVLTARVSKQESYLRRSAENLHRLQRSVKPSSKVKTMRTNKMERDLKAMMLNSLKNLSSSITNLRKR